MSTGHKSFGQLAAVVVGAGYLVVGIVGFVITGFGSFISDTGDSLIGFDLNPFHNVVHLVIGAYLILVSRFNTAVTEGALIGGGAVYLVAAFLGFGNHLQILSINSAGAPDNFLHLASGALALIAGLVSAIHTSSVARRAAA